MLILKELVKRELIYKLPAASFPIHPIFKNFNFLFEYRNAYAFTYGTLRCWSSGSRNTIFYKGTNRHIFPRTDVQVLDTKHWISSPNNIDR